MVESGQPLAVLLVIASATLTFNLWQFRPTALSLLTTFLNMAVILFLVVNAIYIGGWQQ